jgi:threonyl-tRNA synthetase
VQVQVVTVSDSFREYGEKVVARLRKSFVRAEIDPSGETVGKKIRQAVTHKIPNILVVGEREVQDGTVTLRRYGSQEQNTMSLDAFEADLLERIRTRKLDRLSEKS